jgi:hypothetical protein
MGAGRAEREGSTSPFCSDVPKPGRRVPRVGPRDLVGPGDWLRCAPVAGSVLWLRELSKVVARRL